MYCLDQDGALDRSCFSLDLCGYNATQSPSQGAPFSSVCCDDAETDTYQTISVFKHNGEISEGECFDLQFLVYFFRKCLQVGSGWITSVFAPKSTYTGTAIAFPLYRPWFSVLPTAATMARPTLNCSTKYEYMVH